MKTRGSRRRLRKTAALAVAVLALSAAVAYAVIPIVIRVVYAAEGTPVLGRLLSGRDVHPVEHYLAAWREMAVVPLGIAAVMAVAAVILALPAVDSFLARAFGSPDPVRPRKHMSGVRLALIHGVILLLAGGSALHIVTDSESWPFSNYPMYADLARPEIVSVQLFGVGHAEEVPLDRTVYVRPFDHVRLRDALRQIVRDAEREEDAEDALGYALERYHAMRDRGAHDGPPLCGLRLYELRWEVRPGAPNRDDPDHREVRWEMVADCPDEGAE